MTRSRKQGIIINIDWDAIQNKPISEVTFEQLLANGDVGTAPDQVAPGNHDHEIGDMVVLFDNKVI